MESSLNPYMKPHAIDGETVRPPSGWNAKIELAVVGGVSLLGMFASAFAASAFLPLVVRGLFLLTSGAGIAFCLVYAVSRRAWWAPLGIVAILWAVMMGELMVVFLFVGSAIGIPVALFLALVRLDRQAWLRAAGMIFAALFAIASANIYHVTRAHGARRAAGRGQVIIDAIQQYEQKNEALPESLNDLVPEFLDEIPETGMSSYPDFRYLRADKVASELGKPLFQSYELSVRLYKLLQFDCLVYWPEGHYPELMYGGGVEIMGEWAYVHE